MSPGGPHSPAGNHHALRVCVCPRVTHRQFPVASGLHCTCAEAAPAARPCRGRVDMAEIHVERKQGSSMRWLWVLVFVIVLALIGWWLWQNGDRKSTRLNSSHVKISYAVFCLKKKKKKE